MRWIKKNKILAEITDNILGVMRKKYSPKYFFQRITQAKAGPFYLLIRKKEDV